MSRLYFTIILFFCHFFYVQNANFSGRSYYFKTNGNNEFNVYSRIHFLNHNISDFEANPHPPLNLKPTKKVTSNLINRNSIQNAIYPKWYLDTEWDYEHTFLNKSNLPFFIKKIYEQRPKEPNQMEIVRILFNVNKNTTSKIIKFNLDSLKGNENVTDADMYFYWHVDNSSSIYKKSVVLRLYQFEKQFNNDLNESNLVENPDIHKLFNVIYISKAQKGWQTFKIKKPIDNWAKGEDNLGLLLTVSSYDENKLLSIYHDTNEGVFRTFAVLNIHQNSSTISNSSTHNDSNSNTLLEIGFSQNCSRKPWQVNFKDYHWDQFILYPEDGFMAYQCAGKCHVTNDGHVNNHVKLRHLNNGHHVFKERTCCVATAYQALPLMFFDKIGNIALKTYENMVVDKCECR